MNTIDIRTILFIILCILQLLDAYTTYRLIEKELGSELNPVLKAIFTRIGTVRGLILVKTIFLVLTYTYILQDAIILTVFCIAYLLVCVHNITQLKFFTKE